MTRIHDREGNEIEVVTEAELKGWLARYLVAFGGSALAVVFAAVVWAVRLEAKVETNRARIEDVRQEGSLPLQTLRRDLDSLRIEMRTLVAELRTAREELSRRAP